jgi:hypothetical protein
MEDVLFNIARGAGDDLVLLQPPEERHFDPFTAVFAFAGVLVADYMQGFLGSFRTAAESAGERSGQWLKTALIGVFRGQLEPEPDGAELEELSSEVADALARDPSAASQAADAARMHLIDALVASGLPADRALRLAADVQKEVLEAAAGA